MYFLINIFFINDGILPLKKLMTFFNIYQTTRFNFCKKYLLSKLNEALRTISSVMLLFIVVLLGTTLICSHQLRPQLAQNDSFCANFKRTYYSFKTHTRAPCSNASADHPHLTGPQHSFTPPKSTTAVGYSLSYPLSNSAIVLFHIHIQFGWLEFFTHDEANCWANLVGLIF